MKRLALLGGIVALLTACSARQGTLSTETTETEAEVSETTVVEALVGSPRR